MTQQGLKTIRTPEIVAERGGEQSSAHASEAETALELVGVSKEFHSRSGSVVALKDIDLAIRRREFVALVGRSGCGKTTMLRILAGLTHPSRGHVLAGGRPLWRDGARDPETVGRLGIVFQDAHLFPWYSVEENIALPLKLRGVPKAERLARARELCALVGLSGFERSYPRELSGGMRQRAAIARALTLRPRFLLMDEPFGALDEITRERLNFELIQILEESGATLLLVTHSVSEAVILSDQVAVMSPRPGRIVHLASLPFGHHRTPALRDDPRFAAAERELRRALGNGHEVPPVRIAPEPEPDPALLAG